MKKDKYLYFDYIEYDKNGETTKENIHIKAKNFFNDVQYQELKAIEDRINKELKEIEKKFPNRRSR